MCGRYALFSPPWILERRFDVTVPGDYAPTYNAAPGQSLPVIPSDQPDELLLARWGVRAPWDERGSETLINARAETAAEKPSFAEAFERRRCLVPADGFYEWADDGGSKTPHWITAGDDPVALAGIWETWTPETAQTGLGDFAGGSATPDAEPSSIRTFAILTVAANDAVAPVHDRMPAILPRDRERAWLDDGDPTALRPFDGSMAVQPVSTAVNDPSNDSPALLDPTNTGS